MGNEAGSAFEVDFTDRFSTGVVSFDAVIKGGVPIGSLVLMLSDEGAGGREFAFTSAAKLSLVRDKPDLMQFVFGDFYSQMQLPKQVTYISLSRTQRDVQLEIDSSFNVDLAQAFARHVDFVDLSYLFFQDSKVPSEWVREAMRAEMAMEGHSVTVIEPQVDLDLFDQLVKVIEVRSKGGIVFVDSLTDLFINREVDDQELMMLLKGLQRVLHHWRGVVFFLLHKGILDSVEESRLKDCFDAVMAFEWVKAQRSSKRQRYMHFEKFRGVMPVMDRESIIRFNTEISHASGFVVVNVERIV